MSKNFIIPKQIQRSVNDLPGLPSAIIPTKEKAFTVIQSEGINTVKKVLIGQREVPEDVPIGRSLLGTPIYTRVVLKETFDTVINNDIAGVGFIKLDNAIVTVTQSKNIIKTAVQGRNGTIKEYISDGDYTIKIDTVITSPYPLVFPTEELNYLNELLQIQNEIVIDSDFINLFNVSYCVVESYDFNQVEGSRNKVNFTMTLISDYPVELELGITDNA